MRELIEELDRGIASATKAKECGGRGTYGLGVETLKTLRALAARCDQAAGEPAPLPEPAIPGVPKRLPQMLMVGADYYTADQLRAHREEYAETVAAPLRERLQAMEHDSSSTEIVYDLAVRLQAAERERDEARRDAEGWHDERAPLLDVLMMAGEDPFVCAARGMISGVIEEVEKDLKENGLPEFEEMGDGVYTVRANYFGGQYGEFGRCEIEPGYELDFVKFQSLGDGAIDSAMGESIEGKS